MELSKWSLITFFLMTNAITVLGACSSKIEMKWPLIPTTCTEEVRHGTGPISGTSCFIDFVDEYPITSLSNPPFSVRLSGGSYIDLIVPSSSSITGDYGISLYVKPDSPLSSSCIFHYKSDDGLYEMKYISTPTHANASIVGKAFAVHATPLIAGQWQQVGIGIDISQDKVQTFVAEADKTNGVASSSALPSFSSPGKLRIGGSFNGETFDGLVSCVGLVKDKTLDCSMDCYDTGTWSGANKAPEKRNYGTFIPSINGSVPTETPIFSTSTERLNTCAMLCLRNYLHCATIAYDENTKQCALYAGYYFVGMQSASSPNTVLYTLQKY